MKAEWFAGRLRELREAAGLTRDQLAQAAGFSLGGIRDLEQGHRSPSWASVIALAVALGVGVEAFAVEPAPAPPAGRGRPRKPAEPAPPAAKKGKRKK